jgi:type II secretory pathway pseudopilin PulG
LLLEVMVAVAILATAAVSVVGLLAQSAQHEQRAEEVERRLADQERLLTAMTLLSRDDLDRRLGQRSAGPYVVDVQRPTRVLYRVSIALGDSALWPDLVTLIYRPEPSRGPQ